ncbi:MAG: amino acid ABC transporter substrate-binding protein [Desulfuromonadales bacterium]|nr:amino acid ABC transporter substrate-binding protein [Desulfuromonadales bacterium]
MIKKISLLSVLLFFIATSVLADQPATVAGYSPEEAMRLGERMYREGLLPSGEPMQALVQLDIPVEGTMFTCDNCHLRSGLGTVEGTIITLPTNGDKLYRTFRAGAEIETRPARTLLAKPFQSGDLRPAYTDETLADALRNGIDPNGREFDWTMPRYLLDDHEMEIMVHYLKNLSAEYSPGVTDTEIRFATIVADGVPQKDRDAMLLPLQAAVKDRNAQSRHQESRARQGPFYKQDKFSAYRKTVLDVWELKGPRETWRDQLALYYQKTPVFALLGGIVTGDWSPVHEFSEEHEIPSIFPVTDLPVLDDDWYTLYFSKGYYQEGETAARFLHNMKLTGDTPVIQVFVDDPESHLLASGFRQTLKMFGQALYVDQMADPATLKSTVFWSDLKRRYPDAVFALWAGPGGVQALPFITSEESGPEIIFMSSRLLGEENSALPENVRDIVHITYPYRLLTQKTAIEKTVRSWLKIRNIPISNIDIQSKMYFLGWMLTGVTRMMSDDFYRDYFLDVFDMMHDESYAIATYPRVSFGPGQRYASKGCFVAKLSKGAQPELVPISGWIVH